MAMDNATSTCDQKLITVLSIDGFGDGGGIRGLVAATILTYLESELQKLDGEDAKIVDYFDVIAGTNTGGLVMAMLAVPNENKRPLFSAKDIKDFYSNTVPKSSPKKSRLLPFKILVSPKSNLNYLHKLVKEKLGDTKLHQVLTNVVIPTYDTNLCRPTIFSTYKLKEDPCLDALVSGITISTSAPPQYMCAHCFKTKDVTDGKVREFNLEDGCTIHNNPTQLVIEEVQKQGNFASSSSSFSQKRFLVVSLGVGISENNDEHARQRNFLQGFLAKVDLYACASSQMVDDCLSWVLPLLHPDNNKNYLRIQDDVLVPIDVQNNLEKLVELGERLLDKAVSRAKLGTRLTVPYSLETNREALVRFVKLLSEEKSLRRGHN